MAKTARALVTVLFLASMGLDAQGLHLAVDRDRQLSAGDAAWERMRTLAPVGSEIRLTTSRRTAIRGTLRAADNESLTISAAGSERTLTRADVLQVFAPSGTRRQRHITIGLAIGAVAGGILIASRCRFNDTACNEESVAYAASLMVGGAAIGACVPRGTSWRQIYRRPAP